MSTEDWLQQSWALGTAQEDILGHTDGQKDWLSAALRKHKLAKREMWQLADLESDMFMEYCAYDAEACYQLWLTMSKQCYLSEDYRSLLKFHDLYFINEVKLLLEQQRYGIAVNEVKLATYLDKIRMDMYAQELDFLYMKDVKPHVQQYNNECVQLLVEREPGKLTKKGDPSKNWVKWQARVEQAKVTNYFNINSRDQLSWLLFDK
jgi:DNA polymerase I-like protein with 3'-5' exonuclease and polymerase domains